MINLKEHKRWGKEFVDKRNWVKYNEGLVVRGEFLLDMKWVKSWNAELEQMNKGKVGAKYEYPESLIKLQAVWHQLIDYRGVEGVTRKLCEFGELPQYNDFSTINRRVNRMDADVKLPVGSSFAAACDGSGMKFGDAGEYRERMYGKYRRKYIKVVITADPHKKKLLACEVNIEGEGLSEPEVAEKHIIDFYRHGVTITKFWGDGSFDTLDLFDVLEMYGIESAIKIRKGSVDKGDGSLRDREVKMYIKKGYKKWAHERRYGLRWNGTEGIFSAVKRKFGEQTRSSKIENALNEIKRKFWAYDTMKEYAEKCA